MSIAQAALARRSVRSYKQDEISEQILTAMIDAARVGPSAANRQPLEYVVVTKADMLQQVFDCLKWAAYIAPRGTPAPGSQPTAYVVVLRKTEYEIPAMVNYDVGAAIQTILLMAVENGLGTCWLKSINAPKLTKVLDIPEGLEVDSVVSLGYPEEEPELVNLKNGEDEGLEVIKYWRDDSEQHFVPKRALDTLLHWQKF